jgi:hypothetical protein
LTAGNVYVGGDGDGTGGAGTLLLSGTSNINLSSDLYVGDGTGSNGTANLSGGTLGAESVYVGYGGGAGTWLQSGASNISLSSGLVLGNGTGSTGTGSFSAGTLNLPGTELLVGNLGGVGTWLQSGTSSASLESMLMGVGTGSSGTGSFSGGTLDVTYVYIGGYGNGGAGTLLQGGNSYISTGNLYIGDGTGSSGTANLSGGTLGAFLVSVGGKAPGTGGVGTLLQGGNSFISTDYLYIGNGTGSSGTANLSAGTLSAEMVFVGVIGGAGTLLQSGTSNISFFGAESELSIGYGTESTGTGIFSGGSLSAGSEEVFVGIVGGAGTWLQSGTSSVTLHSLVIGDGTASAGTMNLSGGTVEILTGSGIYLGVNGGVGTLLQNGTSLIDLGSGSLIIGVGTASAGTASLSGGTLSTAALDVGGDGDGTGGAGTLLQSGTSWINLGSGSLVIGDGTGSTGTMSTGGGAMLSATGGILVVGYNEGSGTLLQSGNGNLNLGPGLLEIGDGGSGYASISGGTLTAGEVVVGFSSAGTLSQSGSQSFSRLGSVLVSSTGTIAVSGGTMDVKTIDSAGNLSITGGTLAITGAASLGAGSIASSGLSISGNGVLDVGSSGMVIEYGNGISPVGDLPFARTARNYPTGSLQRYAQTAFNGFGWNGPGISSSYAANDPNGLTAVGIADENDLGDVYPGDYTVADGGNGTWMGQPINDTNNVLVRMTWYGDGNLDGVVNRLDVSALSQGYNGIAGYVGWSDGDYTYSGDIGKVDVTLLAQSYLFQGAPLGDAITAGQAQYLLALDPDMPANVMADFQSIAGVPEPAAIGLLGAAGMGLMGRRRRRRQ